MTPLAARRWLWRRRRSLPESLATVWSAPTPGSGQPVEDLRFLVCDAEMTGLDPASCEVLSLGWVCVENLEIDLGTSRHVVLRSAQGVGQSATIHRLRDCEVQEGVAPLEALEALVSAAVGRVLVFHNATLDMAFLNNLAQREWEMPLLLPTVDTLRIEERLVRREREAIVEGELRLPECRTRYGLAPHRGHSALTDAIATAELLLAQIARRGAGLRLRDLQ